VSFFVAGGGGLVPALCPGVVHGEGLTCGDGLAAEGPRGGGWAGFGEDVAEFVVGE
jgi:hypothetical protein